MGGLTTSAGLASAGVEISITAHSNTFKKRGIEMGGYHSIFQ